MPQLSPSGSVCLGAVNDAQSTAVPLVLDEVLCHRYPSNGPSAVVCRVALNRFALVSNLGFARLSQVFVAARGWWGPRWKISNSAHLLDQCGRSPWTE